MAHQREIHVAEAGDLDCDLELLAVEPVEERDPAIAATAGTDFGFQPHAAGAATPVPDR